MEFNNMNELLKPSPDGEGRVRRNSNNSLLQDSLVNQDIMDCIPFIFSSLKPSPSGEGLGAK